jgi:hypothetical protein
MLRINAKKKQMAQGTGEGQSPYIFFLSGPIAPSLSIFDGFFHVPSQHTFAMVSQSLH